MTVGAPGRPEDEQALHRILLILREYLDDLVLVGGWVPQLYRQYGGLASWQSALSRTTEVDVAVSARLNRSGRSPISEALTAAGFSAVDPGPAFAIWRHADPVLEVEFLVGHTGPVRDVGSVRPIEDQEPLGAIQLPDLELLSRFTRVLEVPVRTVKGPSDLSVTVPTLGAFLASRGAILHRRPDRVKGAKDLVYIHDVLAAGDDVVRMVVSDIERIAGDSKRSRNYVRHAATHVSLAAKGKQAVVRIAAEALAERTGLGEEVAEAELVGRLTDYVELLREALGRAS